MKRTEWLILGIALMLSACGMIPERHERGQASDVTLDAGEIVAEAGDVGRLSREKARIRHGRLDPAEGGDDRVRLLLLELYGPAPVRDSASGRSRLAALLTEEQRFKHESGRTMLGLIRDYEERMQAMQARVGRLTGELAEEQAAHAETYEKLEALRQIEEAMDDNARSSNGERGEHDGSR